jgi:hypothetical protein
MFATIVILAFIILEFSNVLAMYFAPGSKYANAVGVFSAWEKSKQDPEIHDFVRYLVYWVAGAKLIFLFLLGVITLFGNSDMQRMSLVALCIATISFYWRLFPLIRKMDQNGQINPKNYSIVIGVMIALFIVFFAVAAIVLSNRPVSCGIFTGRNGEKLPGCVLLRLLNKRLPWLSYELLILLANRGLPRAL